MPQRSSRRSKPTRPTFSCRPSFEILEDRSVPAVLAAIDGNGLITVTFDAANDSATITGTASGGTAIDVTDNTTSTTTSFTGATGISVIDSASKLGQSVRFADSGSGAGIGLTGAITVTGIESVDFATASAILAGSLTVTGADTAISFHADVTTSGASGQSYDGPVLLSKPTVALEAGAAGGIAFLQTVNSDSSGAKGLNLNAGGITSFTGIVGGIDALASITTDAAGRTNLGANTITVGAQVYNDPAVVTGISVTLNSNSGGDIRFESTLNASTSGANSLVVTTSGETTFGGVVGTTPLGGLQTDSTGTTRIKANVSTIGAQNYGDPVVLTGTAIVLNSTVGASINFGDTVDGEVAGVTALTVNTTTGTTTFNGNVGVAVPLLSITTDAGSGTTVIGPNAGVARSVITQGAQTYNDPVRLNASTATIASTLNGNLTFASTLNGTNSVTTAAIFNTGGLTTFAGIVGQTVALASITTDDAGQTGEATVVRATVTTSIGQSYGDAVTFDPGTGITAQALNATTGNIAFQKTLGSASIVPVTVKAGANIAFSGNASFTANGSRFNVQAGASSVGALAIASGITFKADVQTWQVGDGTGGAGSATTDIVTNAPAFRDSTGTNAPRTFVLRQDGAMTDAAVPAVAQFGTAPPANYSIFSDDSTLTLNTSVLAGTGTANLTLSGSQSLTLGATINAPMGIVRLRSGAANVNQTGGGITAAALGVRSGSSQTLTGTNAVTGPFAAAATTSSINFSNGTPYNVGAIGADPLALVFTAVTGVVAGAGTVTFSQPGTSPLNVTIGAVVSSTSVTATGGSGEDRVTVNYTLGGSLPSGLTFNGNGGNDTLALTDAGNATAHTYVLGSTAVRDSATAISYTGVETVSVVGGNAADTFTVTPDTNASIATVGGLPTGASGDKFTLTLTGATTPSLAASKASDGFTGTGTFGNKAAVSFSQMEVLAPQADIQISASAAPTLVSSNGTATITVIAKNAGPDAATGVNLDDVFPIGMTATWTAVASSGSTVSAASGTGDIHTTANLILDGTVTFTITATADPGFLGTIATTATASVAATAFDTDTTNNQATASFTVQPVALLAVGAGAGGGPQVKVYNADGSTRFSFFAYDSTYTGGVTVATGDVTGDGVEDIVTGSASGASHVKVFNGVNGSLLASFFAFPGFTGGVNVAVANGAVVVGAGAGGGLVFAGYQIAGGLAQTFSLFAFDAAFRGGVQVAGSDDLISVAAGPGGAAHVKVFDATNLNLVASFYAFPQNVTTGVNLAMGKSGVAETVIVGVGPGVAPAVVTAEARTGNIVSSVLAFDPSFTGGVRTAFTTTPAGQAGTVYGAGPGGSPRVRIVGPNGVAGLDFYAFDLAFTGGVYVG